MPAPTHRRRPTRLTPTSPTAAQAATSPGEVALPRRESARGERDSLQESSDVFRTLVERGLLQSERRLEMVELVNALHSRHQLFGLDTGYQDAGPGVTADLAAGDVLLIDSSHHTLMNSDVTAFFAG